MCVPAARRRWRWISRLIRRIMGECGGPWAQQAAPYLGQIQRQRPRRWPRSGRKNRDQRSPLRGFLFELAGKGAAFAEPGAFDALHVARRGFAFFLELLEPLARF